MDVASCAVCREPIRGTDPVIYQVERRQFVHLRCKPPGEHLISQQEPGAAPRAEPLGIEDSRGTAQRSYAKRHRSPACRPSQE